MNKLILSAFLSLLIFAGTAQNKSNTICRLGFTYEISQAPNWGKGRPVVKLVMPYSPAESAGIKQNDIIEIIDGVNTTDALPEEIPALLNPLGKNEVVLTVRNLSASSKQIIITKECKKSNTITEDQLATAFAQYSLESTDEREFICPFKTMVTEDTVDLTEFKTYSFEEIQANNQIIESAINKAIGKNLSEKGLKQQSSQPDILVHTFYYVDKNPNYKGTNKIVTSKEPVYRYDFSQNKMIKLPFLNNVSETEAEYILQIGIRFIDQRLVKGRILWECEANELMEAPFRLDEYARIHIPLMCMQYPYVKFTRNVPYRMNKRTYNYTGIQYDINRLELVIDVDRSSPAYAAGMRANDIIEKIGRHKMNHTVEEFTSAYKQFITNTMKYRDQKTMYTDANGFRYCMYWDSFKNPMIADVFQETNSMTAFSYLYYFAPYVNPSGTNACTFTIKRGKQKLEALIRPAIRTELTVEIK